MEQTFLKAEQTLHFLIRLPSDTVHLDSYSGTVCLIHETEQKYEIMTGTNNSISETIIKHNGTKQF
jgi:hypothetical protein